MKSTSTIIYFFRGDILSEDLVKRFKFKLYSLNFDYSLLNGFRDIPSRFPSILILSEPFTHHYGNELINFFKRKLNFSIVYFAVNDITLPAFLSEAGNVFLTQYSSKDEILLQSILDASKITDLSPIKNLSNIQLENFDDFFNLTSEPYYLLDSNWRIKKVNQAFLKLICLSELEIEKKFIFSEDFFEPAEIERIDRILEENQNENIIGPFETNFLCKEKKVAVIIRQLKIIINGEECYLGMIKDISEKKSLVEEARLQSAALFSISNSVIITDKHGTIQSVNPAFTKLTGYTSDEVIGKNPNILKSSVHPREFYENLWNTISNGNIWRGEIVNKKKNGQLYYEETTITPLKDENGQITHFVAVKEDVSSRKKADNEIQESEARFRHIFEEAPIGIVMINLDHTIIDSNRAFNNLVGYELSSLTTNFLEFIRESERTFHSDLYSRLSKGTVSNFKFETEIVKQDGSNITVDLTATRMVDSSDSTKYILLMVEDITMRKLAIRRLQELFAIVSKSPFVIFVWKNKPGWPVELVTENISQFGYSVSEITAEGFLYSNIIHPEDLPMVEKTFGDIINNGKNDYVIRYRIFNKMNQVIWVEERTSIKRDTAGNILKLEGIVFDVSESVLSQESLKKSEIRFRNLYENATIGMYQSTPDGKLLLANTALVKMFGYNNYEDFAKLDLNKDIYVNSKTRKELHKLLQKHGVVHGFESEVKRVDGSIITVREGARAIKDSNGNILYYEGTIEDVTKQKEVERALIVAKETAEEINQLKTNFLANMSHELRTPLIGILGYAEILNEVITEEEFKPMTDGIISSGNRLLETLNLLLDLTRLETSLITLEQEIINPIKLIDELANKYKSQCDKKGIFINVVQPVEDYIFQCDKKLLKMVLDQLINNAVKYTSNGGVTITTTVKPGIKGKQIYFSIADTGIGIPKDKHKLIFEEFRQASEGFTRQYEGTGLGLTIVNKILQLLKGTITLKSEPGKGSVFIISLPYEQISELSNEKEIIDLESETKLTKQKVLIVDDDEATAELIHAYLKPLFNVKIAHSGEDAVEIAESERFNLVLLDIALGPNKSGMQVIRELREMDWYQNVPFIAITSYATKGDKEAILRVGFNQYLAKPFLKDDLLDLIYQTIQVVKK